MNARCFSVVLALTLFATATTAEAAVIKVSPGESIQAAIDAAFPGDTILVEPGIYEEAGSTAGTTKVGLHITTDNLRLIGKARPGQGEDGKVILLHSGTQYTGVYAAPAACGPEVPVGGCPDELQGFYIRGFTVQDFPGNGIQTRFVNGFKIIRNESANNEHNGIYPTISANGLVQNNVSYGALDTAMWVAASENVRVIGNDLYGSPIGLEVNVSVNVQVRHNDVHDNTVGIGLFHPNSAGNLPREDMGNWVVEHNNVYDNNLENPAPPGSFQGALPPGVGILVLGVSDNVVAKNNVENNDFVGIGVLGWCAATSTIDKFNCVEKPPVIDGVLYDPSVNNNLVSQNKVNGNGLNPPTDPDFIPISFLAADLTYFSVPEAGETSSGNCFKKNKPAGYTFVSSEPDGELPTDGC
jgi:hypothetical protein